MKVKEKMNYETKDVSGIAVCVQTSLYSNIKIQTLETISFRF